MARARPRPRHVTTTADTGREHGLPFAAKAVSAEPSAIEQGIFTATEELLQETSLDDLAVAQILERADVSRTTFYRYFTSKHQVVSAMLGALQAELVDVMQPWFARGDREPEAALRDAMSAVASVWARHRPVLRACSEHWHADPEIGERWVMMMDRFAADISKQIDRERRKGNAPKGVSSSKLAMHLTWGSERLLYLAGFGMCGPRMEDDAVDAIVATWLGTVYHQ
jgi:AcrR family transcriptional regulator